MKRRPAQSALCACGHPKVRHRLYPYNSLGPRRHEGRCDAIPEYYKIPMCQCRRFEAAPSERLVERPK